MARTSAWELGSDSCLTALRARSSGLPDLVWTIKAPKGRGLGVLSERAVKTTRADMRWRSRALGGCLRLESDGTERGLCLRAVGLAARVETTPILEISMVNRRRASRNLEGRAPIYPHTIGL